MRTHLKFNTFIFSSLLVLNYSSLLFSKVPTNVTIIEKNEFIGQNYYSVADLLDRYSSVNIQRDGARGSRATPKIRGGSSSNQVVVLMDGRSLTHDFDSQVDLSQIPLNIVERIEITRGGSSLLYSAESVAGTINIVTSRPHKDGFEARLGSGVGRDGVKYSNGRFHGRSYWGDMSFMSGVQKTSGYLLNEQHEARNQFANVTRTFAKTGFWSAEYYYQESEIGLAKGTPVSFNQWNRRLERDPVDPFALREQEVQHVKVEVASPKISSGTLMATFRQSYRDQQDRVSRSGLVSYDRESHTSDFDLRWIKKSWIAGFQKKEFRRLIFPGIKNKTHQNSFYVQKSFEGDYWRVIPSIRHDQHSNADGFTSPRLVLISQPAEKLIVSGTASRNYRVPTYDELFQGVGGTANPNLDPEKSQSFDLGILFGDETAASFKITGYHSRTDDLIRADANTGVFTNRGEEKNVGLETEATYLTGKETRFRHIRIRGNLTRQQSRRDLKNNAGFVQSHLTPEILAFVRVDQILPYRITLSHEIKHQGEQYQLDNKQGLKIPSSTLYNVRFNIKIHRADLYFEVENVTQVLYADNLITSSGTTVLSPQPDRTFFAGITIHFLN